MVVMMIVSMKIEVIAHSIVAAGVLGVYISLRLFIFVRELFIVIGISSHP
jgi:hypothetical protein